MHARSLVPATIALAALLLPWSAAPAAAATSAHPHVAIIVEENRDLAQVIGDPSMPYLNGLAQQYSSSTRWANVLHPSEPNYVALVAGSSLGVVDDYYHDFGATANLGGQLTAAGVPWKAYMEDLPYAGFTGDSGAYVRKHDPFIMFSGNAAHVVPATQYSADLAAGTLPDFVWYTPNLVNDGHDAGNAAVDASLKSLVPPLLASSWFQQGGTIVITYDEDAGQGLIPFIVISQNALTTHASYAGDHYATLRAIEDAYGLPRLGAAATAASIAPLLGGVAPAASVSEAAALDAGSFAQGGAMSGKVTLTSSADITLPKVVLAARPPGGTNGGGPFLDVGTQANVALKAGVATTLSFSRAVTTSDPAGAWYAFPTYQSSDGAWHDGASVAFSVTTAGASASAPPPSASGSFAATFSPYGGNAWWVQTNVASSSAIAAVTASVNGGAPHALARQSWGAWAASFSAPTGSSVVFTATSASGATVTSGAYAWPSGTLLSSSGAAPTPGSFAATFSNARGNAWWVETNVAASGGALVGVDASVNGGAWAALARTSWGSWAKSLYAPAGAQVRFRADAADGSAVVSAAVTWP